MPNETGYNQDSQSSTIPPILSIEGLSVKLGNELILKNINLEIIPGTIHSLIGPNGAGKTTLLRSIMGSMPHKGTIRFRFRNNQRLGYVPQLLDFDHSLPMTVCDFFHIMLRNRPVFIGECKNIREDIVLALKQTESSHLIDRKIGSLSGGELRRVLLAQALVPLPEFLLLDEPASSVDEYGARLFEQLLLDLRKEHQLTVLMVAHDISMVTRISDSATGLNQKITFQGDAKQLSDTALLDQLFRPSHDDEQNQGRS